MTTYNDDTEIEEDERYGKLVIEHFGWGYEDTEGTGSRRTPLETHPCSDAELGLEDDVEYPLIDDSIGVVTTWKKKFRCMKPEDIEIWGDYNSEKAQQITIKLEKCHGYDYCEKNETAIQEWISGKYIVLVYRQAAF